jgi:CDGSH-type Zn-finger protein
MNSGVSQDMDGSAWAHSRMALACGAPRVHARDLAQENENAMSHDKPAARVVIAKNGPYLVSGAVPLARQTIIADSEGGSQQWQQGEIFPPQQSYALCRCGRSAHKPFCDGTHSKVGFEGAETASRAPYRDQAQVLEGPTMALTDAEPLCAFARFCDPNGQVWNQVERTGEPQVRGNFVRQVNDCPSGRLVAWERASGEPVEQALPVSIGVIEDPPQHVSGPLWLRGAIALISADGFAYERRNRMTLCRCGASKNKPFCDGSHAAVGFRERG